MTNSTVEAQRLIIATHKIALEKVETVSRHLFSRYWIENLPVCREEDIKTVLIRDQRSKITSLQVLEKSRMTNVNEMLEQIKQKDIKEELKRNNKEALELGAFGMPWITVTKKDGSGTEKYFGSDRLPLIGDFIGEEYQGPLRHLSLY
ncbi:hypothetical protein PENTCL1PPCAC_10571 [Pristionchus entomophagus]|uniref:DSBA-like thioredoxin domain-containing protein n=1 Tax=Pristionchus entomophagus TaxID=358040 RepID=A0AAV5SYV2_9BILA|nr:hypothetical protein PENTCL1PPCAC_10571 [Pristionchus entomophagus]